MTFDLERFLVAQEPVYKTACDELAAGRKSSHWMWFIFPQLRALGRSPTAKFFGIEGLDEAKAYWAHPVLNQRLSQCARLVLDIRGRDVHQIFGSPDDMKLCSCMTLFSFVAPAEAPMKQVLDRYFSGIPDNTTLALLHAPRA